MKKAADTVHKENKKTRTPTCARFVRKGKLLRQPQNKLKNPICKAKYFVLHGQGVVKNLMSSSFFSLESCLNALRSAVSAAYCSMSG